MSSFPQNPYEHDETPLGEPEELCDFGISADCTEQPEFLLPNGQHICGPCRHLLALEEITLPVQRSA